MKHTTLISLASFAFAFSFAHVAMADECAPPKLLNSMAMEKVAGSDLMTVTATVDGKPERLLVGTGSMRTQLWNAQATTLRLPVQEAGEGYYDFGGRFSQDVARVQDFSMGQMNSGGFYIHVSPNPEFARTGTDGLLGTDMMQRYDIDLDFAHQRLNYFTPEQCQGAGVYWGPGTISAVKLVAYSGLIYVPVMLDGHVLTALLDTSADHTLLNPEIAARYFGLKPDGLEPQRISDGGAAIKTGTHTFSRLIMGGLTANNPRIAIPVDIMTQNTHEFHANRIYRDTYYLHEILPDMVIGMDILQHSHLYLSFQNQRLYIAAAGDGPAIAAQPVQTSWLTVWRHGFDRRLPFVVF
jgi:Aspartyl protease